MQIGLFIQETVESCAGAHICLRHEELYTELKSTDPDQTALEVAQRLAIRVGDLSASQGLSSQVEMACV